MSPLRRFTRHLWCSIFATISLSSIISAQTMAVDVNVSDTSGRLIPGDFAGLSIEYTSVGDWLGDSPTNLNPAFKQMLLNLNGGVLRAGGDSQDTGYWQSSISPCTYPISQNNLNVNAAMMNATGWKAIMGANLARADAANGTYQGANNCLSFVKTGLLSAFTDRSRLLAVGIGNEPNRYESYRYRSAPFTQAEHETQFNRYANTLYNDLATRSIPVAGPGYAFPTSWNGHVAGFLAAAPLTSLATNHYYATSSCSNPPAGYEPTITNLLSESKMSACSTIVTDLVNQASSSGRAHQIEECNSAACRGMAGVSNVFASALWGLDFMFTASKAGTSGVNFHIAKGSSDGSIRYADYNAINSRHAYSGPGYVTDARPLYYAMLMFAREAEGGRFLPVTRTTTANAKAWAVRAPDGKKNVFCINKQLSGGAISVTIKPSVAVAGQAATLVRLKASSLTTDAVTYGTKTVSGNGIFPAPVEETVIANASGHFVVSLNFAEAIRVKIP